MVRHVSDRTTQTATEIQTPAAAAVKKNIETSTMTAPMFSFMTYRS